MKEKLNFLEGSWRTESTAPGGSDTMHGTVTYKWIEGSDWMHCDYVADGPQGKWGAMVLYRWNAEKECFDGHGFMGNAPAGYSEGHITEDGVLRFTFEAGGKEAGEDLFQTKDGVSGTNWIINDDGQREIVMESTYHRLD